MIVLGVSYGAGLGQAYARVWAPDGRTIAFTKTVAGKLAIATISVDGTASAPWAPDGTPIVHYDGSDSWLRVARLDGRGDRALTPLAAGDEAPRW